jgi:hypothetical protein
MLRDPRFARQKGKADGILHHTAGFTGETHVMFSAGMLTRCFYVLQYSADNLLEASTLSQTSALSWVTTSLKRSSVLSLGRGKIWFMERDLKFARWKPCCLIWNSGPRKWLYSFFM